MFPSAVLLSEHLVDLDDSSWKVHGGCQFPNPSQRSKGYATLKLDPTLLLLAVDDRDGRQAGEKGWRINGLFSGMSWIVQ